MNTDITIGDGFGAQLHGGPWRSNNKNPRQMDELTGPVVPNSTRGRRRLARMLDAATLLFLRDGYRTTSIDAILEASGGSKATLYNYFSTKDDLFRAVVIHAIASDSELPQLDPHANLRNTLTHFATLRLQVMFSARHRALLRLIVAERERFPDLAEKYFEAGPQRSREVLAEYFATLPHQQMRDAGEPRELADLFIGLAMNQGLVESLLLDMEGLPAEQASRNRAERAVDRFLAIVGEPARRAESVGEK